MPSSMNSLEKQKHLERHQEPCQCQKYIYKVSKKKLELRGKTKTSDGAHRYKMSDRFSSECILLDADT